MKYLKEFIVGSSIIIVMPFYYLVYHSKNYNKYGYYIYTFLAPLWFGIWNVISLIIAENLNLSKRLRFLIVSFMSLLSIYFIAQFYYKFTKKQWHKYYFDQFIRYMITWNVVIFYLDKYI